MHVLHVYAHIDATSTFACLQYLQIRAIRAYTNQDTCIYFAWIFLLLTDSNVQNKEAHRTPNLMTCETSAPASAGGTDRDLAGTQFPSNFVPYNIIEF